MAISQTSNSYTAKALLEKQLRIQAATDVTPKYYVKNTLNYKYGLWPDEVPLGTPKLRYFGIGIGGRYATTDTLATCAPYIPDMNNTPEQDLYFPIPFRCRPIDEDLTAEERANYRMRVIEPIGNERFVCYYLKAMTLIDTQVQLFKIDPATQLTVPFEPTSAGLTPTPVKPTSTSTQASQSADIVAGVRMNCHTTADEVYEYIDAKFGNRNYAFLSEYGIYSGEDRAVETVSTTGPVRYTESVYTMMSFKTCTGGVCVESAQWSQDRVVLVGDGIAMCLTE